MTFLLQFSGGAHEPNEPPAPKCNIPAIPVKRRAQLRRGTRETGLSHPAVVAVTRKCKIP